MKDHDYDPVMENFEVVTKEDKYYEQGKTKYKAIVKGEYKHVGVGRSEIWIYGKTGMDTPAEEFTHHIQRKIAKTKNCELAERSSKVGSIGRCCYPNW
jgi:hypothetical protein